MRSRVYRFLIGGIIALVAVLMFTGKNSFVANSYTDSIEADVSNSKSLDMTNGLSENMVEDAGIKVKKVDGMPSDFVRGVDLSEIVSEEKSGVVYYDEDGEVKDIFEILSENGINYIKVRVWNDPYDSNGSSYGGGNCDLDNAIKIGARAAKYGMKLMVNFQYSDFWADSSRQYVPKAWRNLSLEQKSEQMALYTSQSLQSIMDAGGVIGIVQIGNETMESIAGEHGWKSTCQLLKSASEAVREFAQTSGQDIRVALDFTNPEEQDSYSHIAAELKTNDVDYDIFATTYYAYWNGSLTNLTSQLKSVASSYGKQVMVAETSYAYTIKDTDGFENKISDMDMLVPGYNASVQGQANMIRDIIQAVVNVGSEGIGVVYSNASWISVGDNNKVNKTMWERYGSGWATKYAVSYDQSADNMYGGNTVDNEALFGSDGKVLKSIKVFGYAYSGASK